MTVVGSGNYDTTYVYSFYTNGIYDATFITTWGFIGRTAAGYTALSNSGVSVSEPMQTNSLNLYLSQNPASNGETNLSYTLKDGGPVQVELMDVLGRKVRMLQNGRAETGQNVIPIDPSTLANGTYFVRVTSPEMTAMEKLVISK